MLYALAGCTVPMQCLTATTGHFHLPRPSIHPPLVTPPPIDERSIAMSVSVCLSVCLSVRDYISTSDLRQVF